MSDLPLPVDPPAPERSASREYVVRFGSMRILGVMNARQPFRYGDEVVARTKRGTEVGTVLCEATATAMDHLTEPNQGRILRRLSDDDRRQWSHFDEKRDGDMQLAGQCVDALKLEMELVDVERILGGELLVVYFLADGRVDFRQLVRDLAREFQTRIEMRQIGVRDEAKLLADYGDCGQPICCSRFLSKMPPVSMKMAKLQKATLDPTKISGRCGRLKCCLRYEFDTYQSIASELPAVGSEILTREGTAQVVAQDILSQQLVIKTDDSRRIMITSDDVIRVTRAAATDGEGSSGGKRGRRGRKKNNPSE